MSSQRITLPLNTPPIKLDRPFSNGAIVHFNSLHLDLTPDPYSASDISSVNLVNDQDIILQISFRRRDDQIVMGSKRDQTWDRFPETIELRSAFRDVRTTVTVISWDDHYQVVFDGKVTQSYQKRGPTEATAVSYEAADGQTLVFSDPITVDVFHTR